MNDKYNEHELEMSIIQMFEEMDDSYMAARGVDIADMKKKVLYKISRR